MRNAEFDVVFDDGTVLNLMSSAAPLFDAEGRVRGVIGAHVDVTGFKRAQAALEEADRRKDEFLATLAHELRNPLAPIRNARAAAAARRRRRRRSRRCATRSSAR